LYQSGIVHLRPHSVHKTKNVSTKTKNGKDPRHSYLYNNTTMTMNSYQTNVPHTIMDSSFAFLDTDFLMNSDLMNSRLTAPKSRALAQLPTVKEPPTAAGFCMRPKRGLGERTQSQRHHVGFSACMVDTLEITLEETFDVHIPQDQKRASAAAKLADRLEKLEAQLRTKEKECLELQKLVESCSQALPQRTMAGRKSASMTSIGGKRRSGMDRQASSRLDPELTRESAEEDEDDFNVVSDRCQRRAQRRASADTGGTARADMVDESLCAASKRLTGRVLPRRTMAGRMAASVRRLFPFRPKKVLASDALVDNTAESVESDYSA
jgi:hypothetical protein